MRRAESERQAPSQTRSEPAPRKLPNRFLRYFLNILVVLHFTAVIAAAGTIGPAPGYVLAVWQVFHPYLQFFFLNHGYNFFAPEPAPSNMLKFAAELPDGSVIEGELPDPQTRPRLLYQRHLLLMEHISLAPQGYTDRWYKSYAEHLCQKYGASKVHMTHVVHGPLLMEMVRAGRRLDDPITYAETDLGDFPCNEP